MYYNSEESIHKSQTAYKVVTLSCAVLFTRLSRGRVTREGSRVVGSRVRGHTWGLMLRYLGREVLQSLGLLYAMYIVQTL